jgi:hypothetical protein
MPHQILNNTTPAPAAPNETVEERVCKVQECFAERWCWEASEEEKELEAIALMEQQAAEEKVAKELEEQVRAEAACKAEEEKAAREWAEVARKAVEAKASKEGQEAVRKAVEAKKMEGLKKGKAPVDTGKVLAKVSHVLSHPAPTYLMILKCKS